MTSGAPVFRFTHYSPITTLRHFIIRDDEVALRESDVDTFWLLIQCLDASQVID